MSNTMEIEGVVTVEASDVEPGMVLVSIINGKLRLVAKFDQQKQVTFSRAWAHVVALANEHEFPQGPALVEQFNQATKGE